MIIISDLWNLAGDEVTRTHEFKKVKQKKR